MCVCVCVCVCVINLIKLSNYPKISNNLNFFLRRSDICWKPFRECVVCGSRAHLQKPAGTGYTTHTLQKPAACRSCCNACVIGSHESGTPPPSGSHHHHRHTLTHSHTHTLHTLTHSTHKNKMYKVYVYIKLLCPYAIRY